MRQSNLLIILLFLLIISSCKKDKDTSDNCSYGFYLRGKIIDTDIKVTKIVPMTFVASFYQDSVRYVNHEKVNIISNNNKQFPMIYIMIHNMFKEDSLFYGLENMMPKNFDCDSFNYFTDVNKYVKTGVTIEIRDTVKYFGNTIWSTYRIDSTWNFDFKQDSSFFRVTERCYEETSTNCKGYFSCNLYNKQGLKLHMDNIEFVIKLYKN
jgi:hypothetical protein